MRLPFGVFFSDRVLISSLRNNQMFKTKLQYSVRTFRRQPLRSFLNYVRKFSIVVFLEEKWVFHMVECRCVTYQFRKRRTKLKPQCSKSTDFTEATKTIWGSFNEISKRLSTDATHWALKLGKYVVALSLFFFLLPQCSTLWPFSCTERAWYKYPKAFRNFAVSQRDVITNWAS